MHTAILSFNTGEVSPYLRHRIDLDKTPAGAEQCENFLCSPYGSLIKRPGLRWLALLGAAADNSAAFPFTSSDGSQYILWFTDGFLKALRPAGTEADTINFMTDYPWPDSPWENGIPALQLVQLNDIAFITHPGTFPLRLRRLADASWLLDFIPFDRPPMKDENLNKNLTFTVASNPVAPDWASGESYGTGDVVFTNCEWKCTQAHTADAAKKPGTGTDWREYWQRMFYRKGDPITILCDDREQIAWSFLYREYTAGAIVYSPSDDPWAHPDNVWKCLTTHTETASSSLNDVGNWQEVYNWAYYYWEIDDLVYTVSEDQIYRCIQAHSSSPSGQHEPGVAADWEDYWVIETPFVSPIKWTRSDQYTVGQVRSRQGRVYECTTQHEPAMANVPGMGADWEDYWTETSRMVAEFTADEFSPGMYFRISPERDEQDFQTEITAQVAFDGQTSEPIAVQGAWNFTTYGTWRGIFQLQRSANGGISWAVIRSWESDADRNISDAGTEDDPVLLRLKFISTGSNPTSATTPRGVLEPESPFVTGYALCDTYVSADEMTGTAKTAMLSGNTYRWAECAFNSRDGFPRAIALHESRLVFAGTAAQPVSLWLSATDDLLNFETGPESDDGIAATLALTNASPIRWLASQRRLFIGTALGEWAVGSETSDQPLTPTNFLARQYTAYGSHGAQPLIARDAAFFLERKAARLRELAYDDSRGSYDAADLTRLAEHLTRDGIASFAWQQTREPALWAVTRSGLLLHFAYNRPERVSAWSRHTTANGTFQHVVVLPSDDGDDHVMFITDRGGYAHLERFPENWLSAQESDSGWFYLDGVSGTGTTIAIPSHLRTTGITRLLNSETVSIQNYTGLSTQTIASQAWAIGRPISSRFDSLPIDLQAQDGTTQARSKRVSSIRLSLYQARGGSIWNRTQADAQPIRGAQDALFTGWTETVPDPGHLEDLQFHLVHSDPFPFTLRSACLRFNVHER